MSGGSKKTCCASCSWCCGGKYGGGGTLCFTEERKKKFIKADLFQTPEKLDASVLGALNGFVVLPLVVVIYAILLASTFNPIQSHTTIKVTLNCTPLEFTCTSKYGCEIAALGEMTTAKFSKGNGIVLLEKGASATEMVCPGQHEALDFAPRAYLKISGNLLPRSLAWNGFGYFVAQAGTVYKVDLTTMRLIQQMDIMDGILINTFQEGNSSQGYFVSENSAKAGPGNHIVYKMDLDTMAIVGAGTLGAPPSALDPFAPFAYDGYAYFSGGNGSVGIITKFNLTTMKVEQKRNVPGSDVTLHWGVVGGYYQDSSSYRRYGYFKDSFPSSKLFKVDLNTLNVTQTVSLTGIGVAETIKSVCTAVGTIHYGTSLGKTLDLDPKTLTTNPLNNFDVNLHFPITSLLCTGLAGVSPSHQAPFVYSYGLAAFGTNVPLDGANILHAPIETPEAVYFLSKYSTKESHVLKLDAFDKENADGILYGKSVSVPEEGVPIGHFQNLIIPNFPPTGSKRSTFSLFASKSIYTSNQSESLSYMFWPEYVHGFREEGCRTSQPNYLCKRVNLAPTELLVEKSYKYSVYVIVTLCLTTALTLFRGLKAITRNGPKVCEALRNKCCNGRGRELNLLAAETANPAFIAPRTNGAEISQTHQT